MPNVSYDTLTITINADSKQANASIKALSTNLKNLEEVAKSLDTKAISAIKKLLQDIAKIDFSNVTKGLQSVVSAFKAFNSKSFKNAFSGLSGDTIDTGAVKNELVAVEDELHNYKETAEEVFGEDVGVGKQTKDIKGLREMAFGLYEGNIKLKEMVKAVSKEMKVFNGEQLSAFADMLKQAGFSAEEVTKIIKNLKTDLGALGVTVEGEVISPLEQLGLTSNQLSQVMSALDKDFSKNTFDATELDNVREALEAMGISGERLDGILGSLKQEAEETINPFAQMGFNGKQVAEIMRAINFETDQFSSEEIERLKEALTNMGMSSEKVDDIIARLKKDTDKLGNSAEKKATSGLKKLVNQFKNIMKYRIIRKIIQEIYKALSEGIKNVAEFDAGVNDSLSKITSAFQFFKNSIGAVLAPLVQMIEPILSEVMMLVGDLNNAFAEVFAGANGQTTFSKAEYDLKKFNEQAKKTQALGIDELNVFQQDDKGGFTTEQVDLTKEENNLASKLKDTIAKIKEFVEPIFKAFKDLVSKIMPALNTLLSPILSILSVIFDLLGTLIDETFNDVNNSLISFVEMIGEIFNFVAVIVKDLAPTLKQIIYIISSVLNIINSILGGSFDWVSNIFKILSPIIHALNVVILPILNVILAIVTTIFAVVEGIVKSLVDLVTFNWGDLGNVWSGVGNKIEKAWTEMGKGNAEIYGYASGGFPEDGLFMANHNELVGQFSNGKTAVANNAEITQGIYEAVLQAMRESGNNGGISIQIDGQELAKVIKKKQDNFGADLFVGGNLAYGK